MEIRFNEVNYRNKLRNIDFKITSTLIGITGSSKEYLAEILNAKYKLTSGKCFLNTTEINKENSIKVRKKVAYVKELPIDNNNIVLEEIEKLLNKKGYTNKKLETKIIESLKMLRLTEDIIYRKIDTLSSSERKLLSFAMHLIYNPQVIIIDEPFKYLDYNNKKHILKLIKLLREKYNKTIIVVSDDVNILYQYTDHIIILNNNTVYKIGESKKVFKEVDNLIKNKIPIPDLIKFTYLAKQKGIRLMYHRDIRDLIKDIYKHV